MTTGTYSFIDIAVLDGVRGRFAAGDPLVLLSPDLKTLLWVNGPGAALLGFETVETAMGAWLDLDTKIRRQIAAISGFPAIGTDRPVTIRLNSGLKSMPLACRASNIALPGGAEGILLTVPDSLPSSVDPAARASRAISGINALGHYAALIDGLGNVVAGSRGFDGLNLTPSTLQSLARRAAGQSDRLVKRMVPAGNSEVAAGIGRLADDPALNLLIAVDEMAAEAAGCLPDTVAQETDEPSGGTMEFPADREPEEPALPETVTQTSEQHEADTFHPCEPELELEPAEPAAGEEANGTNDNLQEIRQEQEAGPSTTGRDSEEGGQTDKTGPDTVRFVWGTDAQGHFSTISTEFTDVVGIEPSDIVGTSFDEIARRFGFDADQEISGLLARRDTWSGRSVLWPLQDRAMRVPVDLAALPAYSRTRQFEGFRGFGVVRLSEAVPDDGSMVLDPKEEPVTENGENSYPPEAANTDEPEKTEAEDTDPFLGEKPAIELTPTPQRRENDRAIQLIANRNEPVDDAPAKEPGVAKSQTLGSLSDNEKLAFREIGKRLTEEKPVHFDEPPTESEPEVPQPVRHAASADTDGEKLAELHPAAGEEPPQDQEDKSSADDRAAGALPSAFAGIVSWPPGGSDISILEQLPVAVLIRSGDTLHYANPEFLRLTGYSSIGELAARGGFDVLFASPDGLADENDERARPSMRLITHDGSELLCEAYLRSVRWQEHRALMLAIRPSPYLTAPVAGPQPGDSELEERVKELGAILDTATDGVVLVTRDGDISSLNQSAEALFGFESGDVVGKPFTALFAVESQKAASDYLSGLSGPGVASILNDGREVIGREAQGRFIPLFMTMGTLPGDRGYCAVLRDITPWKRAEEELTNARGQAEKASSLKTDFLARISHEVRTPLNAIIGFSELMMDEKFGPIGNERYRDYLRDINRSGNHVLDLVNDLLDISKIEAGEQEMDFESVWLNDTLADAVALMQPEANRERVIIRSSLASNLPEVVADLRSVKQIALNLLSNAIRFTPAGGQVIVSTAYDLSGDVIMRIRDTGIGMSRTEVEQALRPFKQITSLKNARQGGTGLGLPLTKAMVEANRAGFSIESKPEEGTIVEVVFPSTRVLAD